MREGGLDEERDSNIPLQYGQRNNTCTAQPVTSTSGFNMIGPHRTCGSSLSGLLDSTPALPSAPREGRRRETAAVSLRQRAFGRHRRTLIHPNGGQEGFRESSNWYSEHDSLALFLTGGGGRYCHTRVWLLGAWLSLLGSPGMVCM